METLRYHTIEELRGLTLAELQALWELVPTDRQRAYKAAYEREVRTAGAVGSDQLERRVASALAQRYTDSALVPVGSRWARTPSRVQESAKRGTVLDAPESGTQAMAGRRSPKMILIAGLVVMVLVGAALSRGMSGRGGDIEAVTPDPSATPTPLVSPTPTPLALEAQDDIIRGGDSGREVAYPVNLQVSLPDGSAPRVWVVQRRRVQASEWRYDPNPDTASSVSGMSVRPVIGVPWSEENAAFFDQVEAGASFVLTMNTGAVQRFVFEDKREVRRSETGLFRQVSPGLVLLLIGKTDADGFPTATRTLVTAAYPPEQELARSGELIGLPVVVPISEMLSTVTPEPTAQPVSGVDVQLVRVTTNTDRVTVQLRAYNSGAQPIRVTADDLWLALGYVENPPGPHIPAEGLAAFDLLPGQAADLTLIWPWAGEPFASIGVLSWRWAVEF